MLLTSRILPPLSCHCNWVPLLPCLVGNEQWADENVDRSIITGFRQLWSWLSRHRFPATPEEDRNWRVQVESGSIFHEVEKMVYFDGVQALQLIFWCSLESRCGGNGADEMVKSWPYYKQSQRTKLRGFPGSIIIFILQLMKNGELLQDEVLI